MSNISGIYRNVVSLGFAQSFLYARGWRGVLLNSDRANPTLKWSSTSQSSQLDLQYTPLCSGAESGCGSYNLLFGMNLYFFFLTKLYYSKMQ